MITIRIEDITDRGIGVGRTEEGMTVFVSGGLPGDLVRAEITKQKKRYANARAVEILEESGERADRLCAQSLCGGCPYSKLTYDAQLRIKQKHVYDALSRLGGIEDPLVHPAVGMADPYRYRNKAVTSVSTGGIITKKGGIVVPVSEPRVGFYRARSHETVDCPVCLLQTEAAEAAAAALRRFMREDHITGYDSKWKRGLMRNMIVRTAMGTGEVMVILVINGRGIPNAEKLVSMLDEAIDEVGSFEDGTPWYSLESVVVNINAAAGLKSKGVTNKKGAADGGGALYGDRTYVLAGKPTIAEHVGEMDFEISPMSFYQVNPQQMEVLYDIAARYADLQGGETVLDLYCGAGTIGLWLLNDLRARDPEAFARTRVLGIESVKDAVLDANRNAVLNRIVNARYVCGKAEEVLPDLMSTDEGEETVLADSAQEDFAREHAHEGLTVSSCDVAILDPPRAGCEEALLDAVCNAEPSRIVYVSCDPATLARDIRYLSTRGYQFCEATPVDLFPQTGHCEVVVSMSRVGSRL